MVKAHHQEQSCSLATITALSKMYLRNYALNSSILRIETLNLSILFEGTKPNLILIKKYVIISNCETNRKCFCPYYFLQKSYFPCTRCARSCPTLNRQGEATKVRPTGYCNGWVQFARKFVGIRKLICRDITDTRRMLYSDTQIAKCSKYS